jgi:hypothetical protein
VEGRTHDDDAHDPPVEEELPEAFGSEPIEPRPQRGVRVQRQLRLEADEVLDRIESGHVRAPEQQLALERGPVQRPPTQDLVAHVRDSGGPGTKKSPFWFAKWGLVE